MGVAMVGETPSLTGSLVESEARAEQASSIVSSLAPPPQAVPQGSKEGCLPWRIPKALPPYNKTAVLSTKKYGPKERTDQNSRERAKLRGDSLGDITLPDAEFKTLVIKMLTTLIELGQKMKEQIKAPKVK